MTTFRALVCDIPGSDAKRTAYRVVHDAFCAEVLRELGQRLEGWPPASASRLLAAEPSAQAAHLPAWLNDLPAAWRHARGQLCQLATNAPRARRHAGHLAWVLCATVFDSLSPPVLQAALREMPEVRLAALFAYGTSHLPLFQYVANHELQRRLASANAESQAVTGEIQACAEVGRLPDAETLRDLSMSLRRRAVLTQALDGGSSTALAAAAAAVISTAQDGTGLAPELQVLLDTLLSHAGGQGDNQNDGDEDTTSMASILTLADNHVAVHASACLQAVRAVHRFVAFARRGMAPVFFGVDGRPLRLARLLAVRAALVDDGGDRPAPRMQLVASIGVRGNHPPVTLIIVAHVGAAGTVTGLADYAQLRNARPERNSGKFAAVV
ncbi:hypothetical protein [Achromobacter aloeverae]|uniref:Uncharacterized protein n=1 Tax=Achromobacter aloeverae TaxID=1750518 RepID=A0A4Q1HJX2_9BURK|nr:hypothetical protein [Achromobacter aloeverae]RXN90400.1 hypothetical protein C7R54_12910 [Achromobacter aloeverae]